MGKKITQLLLVFFMGINLSYDCAASKDGIVSSGRIVIPEKPSPTEKFSGEELQKYIEKVTGTKITLANDSLDSCINIYIGKAISEKEMKAMIPDTGLGEEGFIIARKQNSIYIGGMTDRATLYGVYDFIERFCGIRWFAPGPVGEVVPVKKDICVPEGIIYGIPSFDIRGDNPGYRLRNNDKKLSEFCDWAYKNKLNCLSYFAYSFKGHKEFFEKRGGTIKFLQWGHNFHRLVPPAKYFKKHPDFYPLVGGKRICKHAQLCFSNKELQETISEKIIKAFDNDPDAKGFGVFQEDGILFECECENCRALDPAERDIIKGRDRYFITNRLMHFVNGIAEKVNRKHPGKYIGTYAYDDGKAPPRKIKPDPHVLILYAYPYVFHHRRAIADLPDIKKELEEWCRATDNLILLWFINFTPMHPETTVDMLKRDFPLTRKCGVKGISVFTGNGWGGVGYLINPFVHLMWNADADIDKLLDDYYEKYYQDAGKWIKKYHELMEKTFADGTKLRSEGLAITGGDVRSIQKDVEEFFRKAREEAKGDRLVNIRIERVYQSWLLWKFYSDMLVAYDEYKADPSKHEVLRKALERIIKLADNTDNMDSIFSRKAKKFASRPLKRLEQIVRHKTTTDEIIGKYKHCMISMGWKIKADPENIGENKKWFALKNFDSWQNTSLGYWQLEGKEFYEGNAWYQVFFRVPDLPEKTKVFLFFSQIDESARLYLNGSFVSESIVGPAMRTDHWKVDITSFVRKGEENSLVIKVYNANRGGGIIGDVYLLTERKPE